MTVFLKTYTKGLLQKGIFRKSPSSEELKFVKDDMNRGMALLVVMLYRIRYVKRHFIR